MELPAVKVYIHFGGTPYRYVTLQRLSPPDRTLVFVHQLLKNVSSLEQGLFCTLLPFQNLSQHRTDRVVSERLSNE